MWLGRPLVITPPTAEPLRLEDARSQCRLDPADASQDADVSFYLTAARARIERRCGIKLITQTVQMRCDSWADLDNLPIGIIQSITPPSYGSGGLPFPGCALASPGALYPSAILLAGSLWPPMTPGDIITLTAVAGFGQAAAVPEDIILALRLLVSHYFDNRGPVAVGDTRVLPIPEMLEDILTDWKRTVLV